MTSLLLLFTALLLIFCHPSSSYARTPTIDGWNFDIVRIQKKREAILVYIKNSSRVTANIGKIRVNILLDGREVDSRYLDIPKGEVSVARFMLSNVTGTHSVCSQVWGGWYYAWKFDETPPRQINLGGKISPPSRRFEITSRESGPYTIYTCKFSSDAVNRMADDWNVADNYARKISWKIVNDKFRMSKEILIALAVSIKATADNLHYQSKKNKNCILIYELNFDNRAVPAIQTLQIVQSAMDMMHMMFRANRFIWYPISKSGFSR